MAEWVTLGPAAAVPEGEVTAFGVGQREVAVANVEGDLHAFDDVCTHQQCSLAEGELDGPTVECPCHGSQFDVTSGAVLRGPAEKPVRSRTVRWRGCRSGSSKAGRTTPSSSAWTDPRCTPRRPLTSARCEGLSVPRASPMKTVID